MHHLTQRNTRITKENSKIFVCTRRNEFEVVEMTITGSFQLLYEFTDISLRNSASFGLNSTVVNHTSGIIILIYFDLKYRSFGA